MRTNRTAAYGAAALVGIVGVGGGLAAVRTSPVAATAGINQHAPTPP